MEILKRTWAEIDLSAVEHNFKLIKNRIKDSKICCVVKADAYGHGANILASTYERLKADFLAVSNIDEAEEIRMFGVSLPILILGYTPTSDAERLSRLNLTQTVYGKEYAQALSKSCVKAGIEVDVHIKIDTGMSRIGFMCQSFPRDNISIDEIANACSLPGLNPKGIMAHFAVSDEGESGREYTTTQLEAFDYTVAALKEKGIDFEVVHHANSAGIFAYENSHKSMVRAGIVLYGLAPSPLVSDCQSLKPVMTVKSSVAHVKEIKKGTCVSYGRIFVAQRDMKIATITIGYADGYFRGYQSEGYMVIKGKKAPILGRVCMDQTMVDVTDIEDVKIGCEAVVLSADSPTADELAGWADTINYEVVCAVSKRVPRYYIKDGKITDVMYKL